MQGKEAIVRYANFKKKKHFQSGLIKSADVVPTDMVGHCTLLIPIYQSILQPYILVLGGT